MSSLAITHVDYILWRLRKTQYQEIVRELEYLEFYLKCLAKWDDSSSEFLKKSKIEAILEEASEILRWDYPLYPVTIRVKAEFFLDLMEKVEQCKPKIEKYCLRFLDCSFQCEFSDEELRELIMIISTSLYNILLFKSDMLPHVKVQIISLQDNLDLFKDFFEFSVKWCSSNQDLKDFKIHFQDWASRAACLSFLYWVVDMKNQNIDQRITDVILSDPHKKIKPSTLEVIRMCFAVLKSLDPPSKDRVAASKLVMKFVQFLKDNFQVDVEEDKINDMIFFDFIFLITFRMEWTESDKFEEEEWTNVINEVTSLVSIFIFGDVSGGTGKERSFILHNFFEKTKGIKAEVRRIYSHLFQDSLPSNYPRINMLGFVNSLFEKLKEFSIRFPKYQIMKLQEELLLLKEDLGDFSIFELEKKHNDIKELWTRVVNLAYNAERAVNSFIYVLNTLWYAILCISDVIEEINLIKDEMKRIKEHTLYDIPTLNFRTSSYHFLPLQANIEVAEKVVGFMDEVEEIKGRLIRGSTELDIVSIVGMPGVGKTTLANKVYNDTAVRRHFHKRAWCTISQTINSGKMFLDIVSQLDDSDFSELSKLDEEDLAESIYRSLKKQRYLIVLDDIWDVSAWNALKMSFPDDNNRSRIIFTSRDQKLVSEAKSDCNPFPLNPLADEESWKLLEMKTFGHESCPPMFFDIGKQMARQCKGLPLSLVLVAGLLRENIQNLDWWKQVGENMDSLIAKGGCEGILELSYRHLPQRLRPCFLYFGSFPEDEEIKVDDLTESWISEGFVEKDVKKSLEVVAVEYLMDLVSRSLVIATKRSVLGRIKYCQVHDLLHDFCLAKGQEENIFTVVRNRNKVPSSHSIPTGAGYAHYRVCISEPENWISFLEQGSSAPIFVHSVHSFYRYKRFPKDENSKLQLKNIHNLISNSIHHFKFLQVLNLSRSLCLPNFPEEITELTLLRSLVLWGVFKDIPSSIKRLENLEVLGLYIDSLWNSYSFILPLTTWEMQKLRVIHLKQAFMPLGFCDDTPTLHNVQVFSDIFIPYKLFQSFLRKIPNIRMLDCQLEKPHEYNEIVKLDFLSHLESLHVSYHEPAILHMFPFHLPSTLKKLNFEGIKLPWSEVSAISKLPNLEVLKLCNSFTGEIWNVEDDEFLKLKFLKLINLDIEKWEASDESLACLETLAIYSCKQLEAVPSRIASVTTLKMIKVRECRFTLNNSVLKIQEDQIELENEDLQVFMYKATDTVSWTVSNNSDLDSKELFFLP